VTRLKLTQQLGLDESKDYVDVFWLEKIEKGLELLGESVTKREMKALRVKTSPLQVGQVGEDDYEPMMASIAGMAPAMEALGQILGEDGTKRWMDKVHRALSAAFENELKVWRDNQDLAERLSKVTIVDPSPQGTAQLWLMMHDAYNDDYIARRGARLALIGPVNTWFRREGARLQKIALGAKATPSAGCLSSSLLILLAFSVLVALLFR